MPDAPPLERHGKASYRGEKRPLVNDTGKSPNLSPLSAVQAAREEKGSLRSGEGTTIASYDEVRLITGNLLEGRERRSSEVNALVARGGKDYIHRSRPAVFFES